MTTFNDREKAFEQKFEHDQEIQFKVNARRNKLLGLWAALDFIYLAWFFGKGRDRKAMDSFLKKSS